MNWDLFSATKIPTFNERIMLIQQDDAAAQRQAIALQARIKRQRIMSDLSLEIAQYIIHAFEQANQAQVAL